MARKRRLKVTDSNEGEGTTDYSPREDSEKTYTVAVANHTHAGVSYKFGDPFSSDFAPTIEKLKRRGIIS